MRSGSGRCSKATSAISGLELPYGNAFNVCYASSVSKVSSEGVGNIGTTIRGTSKLSVNLLAADDGGKHRHLGDTVRFDGQDTPPQTPPLRLFPPLQRSFPPLFERHPRRAQGDHPASPSNPNPLFFTDHPARNRSEKHV